MATFVPLTFFSSKV